MGLLVSLFCGHMLVGRVAIWRLLPWIVIVGDRLGMLWSRALVGVGIRIGGGA